MNTKPKQGRIDEIVAGLIGRVIGGAAGLAIKGTKNFKAGAKQQIQKARDYDADDKLRKDTRNRLDKVGSKKEKPNKGSKIALKNKKKKDSLRASLKASENIMAKKKEAAEAAQDEEGVNEMKNGRIDSLTSFAATYISEGYGKTERQFKGTAKAFAAEKNPKAKTKKLKRMVKLARKHKSQKEKSLDRKAGRDVERALRDDG